MKIVVIGGTGLIGSKTVQRLQKKGHDVIAAAPNTGVNTITGEGLDAALEGAQVVVDLANSPSFDDEPALDFFKTSGENLIAAETEAGVGHHIALSVVGTQNLQGSGYFRAKQVQEKLIKSSPIPYTIIHSTQFFEFMGGIAASGADGNVIRVPTAFIQPIASDDVADFVADLALGAPNYGIVEIAGRQKVRLNTAVERYLSARNDERSVIGDPHASYFGVELNDASLMPGPKVRTGKVAFDEWINIEFPLNA
ncbi:SDR family oxidoreductase [Roseovarius sp. B08]|uniref:SDR family oxidoreductase n=1 Tax=Roseovarius sp. B08 TaxID=3449223 RepID=UPI003EDC28CC